MARGVGDGLLNLAKVPGPTSHDVVAAVRRVAGTRRVGHAGTLDPAAAGVLLILIGGATRLARFFQAYPKRYAATLTLGEETATGDAEGDVVARYDVPAEIYGRLDAVASSFRGEIRQEVPAYAAVKRGGEPLYRKARRGETVEAPVRAVTIYDVAVTRVAPPAVEVEVACSSGTYIRALARDIGRALGVGAHLAALTRLAVGRYELKDALPQEQLPEGRDALFAAPHFAVLDALLSEMTSRVLRTGAARDFVHGREFSIDGWLKPGTNVRCTDEAGRLLGVAVAVRADRARADINLLAPGEL